MVFLTSLHILDTGFLDVATRTGQLGTSNRVNSGAALQLKGVELELTTSSALDKSATPGFRPASIKGHEKRALITVNPTTFSLTLTFNRSSTDTTNIWGINDMSLLSAVASLPHTAGFKALYYPVDNTATDTGGNSSRQLTRQMVYQLGATDTIEDQGDLNLSIWTGVATAGSKDLTDVNYIPVRFESCTFRNTADNKLSVTLSGVVTG